MSYKNIANLFKPDSLVKSRKLTPRSLSLQSVRLDSDHIRWWECHSMVRVFDVMGMLLCCEHASPTVIVSINGCLLNWCSQPE